jgi:hypothetical protein
VAHEAVSATLGINITDNIMDVMERGRIVINNSIVINNINNIKKININNTITGRWMACRAS